MMYKWKFQIIVFNTSPGRTFAVYLMWVGCGPGRVMKMYLLLRVEPSRVRILKHAGPAGRENASLPHICGSAAVVVYASVGIKGQHLYNKYDFKFMVK